MKYADTSIADYADLMIKSVSSDSCHIHMTEEPRTRKTYLICFECNHAYTRRDLVRTERALLWEMLQGSHSWRSSPYGAGRLRLAKLWLGTRAKRIQSCPHCAHDF